MPTRNFSPKVLSVTLKGVVRIFGTDSASEGAGGLFKRRRKETEEVVNIEEKRCVDLQLYTQYVL